MNIPCEQKPETHHVMTGDHCYNWLQNFKFQFEYIKKITK